MEKPRLLAGHIVSCVTPESIPRKVNTHIVLLHGFGNDKHEWVDER
jgi:predicted esterase